MLLESRPPSRTGAEKRWSMETGRDPIELRFLKENGHVGFAGKRYFALAREGAGNGRRRHGPRIDERRLEAGAGREWKLVFSRAVIVEVIKVDGAGIARIGVIAVFACEQASGSGALEQFAKESNAGRTCALQFAGVRPRRSAVVGHV